MKILFVTDSLNYRGTTRAILDYAKYNQEFLGNESVIAYNQELSSVVDMGNEPIVIKNIDFEVVPYSKKESLNHVIEKSNPDLIYRIGSGENYNKQKDFKSVYHAVFQYKNDQIDAYVSQWLSRELTDYRVPFVPHIVKLPEPTMSYRKFFDIPKDAVVIGRHGGYETFDIEMAKDAVREYVEMNPNVYFLFLNTKPFFAHNRVIYVNPTYDVQTLSNYINTCDAMLHARTRGESFGLAICEFLYHNKPVFAWNGGTDGHHRDILSKEFLYDSKKDLIEKLDTVKDLKDNFSNAVKDFSPEIVMKKFDEVFIRNEK